MKYKIIILTLLFNTIIYAQNQEGTLILKDGSRLTGLLRIKNNQDIKFKTSKESEITTTYTSFDVARIETVNPKQTLVYKTVETFFETKEKFIDLLEEGTVNLYFDLDFTHNSTHAVLTYYVDKKGEDLTKIFPVGFLGNGSDAAIIEYFNDCSKLQELLKREAFKKYVKMKKGNKIRLRLVEIIKYYNSNCSK